MIIPVYDRPAALNRALASIADQSKLPAKVIVVDDASSWQPVLDPECVRRLDIELIRHKKNRGAAAARNTGLRSAETEWVSFLDSDDFLLGDSLEKRWQMVEQRLQDRANEATIFGCGWIDFVGDGRAIGLRWPLPSTSRRDFASGCWFSPGSCVMINRTAAVQAAGFQDEALQRFEDFDWFLSLALEGFVLEVLPIAAVSVERQRVQRPDRIEMAAMSVVEKWRRRLSEKILLDRIESYMNLEIAAAHYFGGSKLQAIARLAASIVKVPRLSLQLSPGWSIEKVTALPSQSIVKPVQPRAASLN